jgi:glycosyltransferase involved in cell wall biosynthesis
VASKVPTLPLLDGYVLHLWHLITETARLHDVRLIVLGDEGDAFAGVPVTSAESIRGLRSELSRVAAEFSPHVVHVVGGTLADVWPAIPSAAVSVLGALDAAHLNVEASLEHGIVGAARSLARRRLILRRIRRSFWRYTEVVVVSEEDRLALEREDSRMSISVVPNGVDLSLYSRRPGVEREPGHLVFTGALDYAPNVATAVFLAEQVMPLVIEGDPSAELYLVGRDPSERVTALGDLPGVTVVGPVEHMSDALSRASVYVCPMVSGTGIKNKLLEALANGLPCVASTLAVRGMRVEDGEEVLIADTAAEIADAVLRLLRDDGLRGELSASGRSYVSANHTWAGMASAYGALYESRMSD